MLNYLIMSEITEQCLAAEETSDSCRLEFIEIVPLTRDTDRPGTTEVKQENLSAVKQEPDDVCCIVYCLLSAYKWC